ncbi:MAG TPA: HesA/MoeB/ThiF family protein [Gammaproteobacteria bacterium]|nr:HesA/MoeB/ThiF family protein [Gammaproteobacteria bacterium]
MDDQQLLRYSRHILLPQIGMEGQQKLLRARVFIIGMGGLGSPLAMYLAASGVGHLVIADLDQVELSNLQRQILYRTADIAHPKVEAARDTLLALNPAITVTPLHGRLSPEILHQQIHQADVIVDASDNFPTRFALNAACVQARKPLVSGAAIRMEGQVAVFRADLPDSPCYRCLYHEQAETEGGCAQLGVLAPLLGVIGSVQAIETIKLLLGIGTTLASRLLLFDALHMEWRSLKLHKDPACPVCSA